MNVLLKQAKGKAWIRKHYKWLKIHFQRQKNDD
ncbi:Uncharacterised protein [uncultured Clostridium sp.]|nr:Uncharacterised protein [uncultured Clostridium sp.]